MIAWPWLGSGLTLRFFLAANDASPTPSWGDLAWLGGLALAMIVGGAIVYRWFYTPLRNDHEVERAAHAAELERSVVRLEAAEGRYRDMVDRYASRTYDAAAALGQATDIIRALADRDERGSRQR